MYPRGPAAQTANLTGPACPVRHVSQRVPSPGFRNRPWTPTGGLGRPLAFGTMIATTC